MLRPIKNFLTYLQKNANGATIFGLSSNSMNEEEVNINDSDSSITVNNDQKMNDNDVNEKIDEKLLESNKSELNEMQQNDQNDNNLKDDDNEENLKRFDEEIDVRNLTSQNNDEGEVIFSIWATYNHDEGTIQKYDNKDMIKDDNVEIDPLSRSLGETESIVSNQVESVRNDDDIFSISTLNVSLNTKSELELKEEQHEKSANSILALNEVIVADSPEQNRSTDDSATDPLAIDDVSLSDIHTRSVSKPSNSHNSNNENGIIMIIDVENIKESSQTQNDHVGRNLNSINGGNDDRFRASIRLTEIGEEQEVRSDGSDSGLGSETPVLSSTANSDTSLNVTDSNLIHKIIPTKSNLKRRCDGETMTINKKPKRSIHFNGVSVYYFPRMQGFACVPSQGGCTLGMGARHTHFRTFTLAEHAAEQRRVHKQQMQEINPRSSSSDDTDSDEEISEASGSDLDADANGFLQPVPAKQRRALLKAAGIRKIDTNEKDECRIIRSSREFCGCSCRGFCDPDTCSCSQAGIKCQVDRPSFPCGCSHDGCANVVGRVEFNPNRVRTHFIHTIMRLDLENKQKRADEMHSIETNSMLNYGNNCGNVNTHNLGVPTTMNTLNNPNSNANNLNNMCNYNLTNTNHIRSQPYGHILLQHLQRPQHNQTYNNGHNHTNLFSNSLLSGMSPMDNCLHPQLQQQQLIQQNSLINNNNSLLSNNSNIHNISNNLNLSTTTTHPIDLHYAFRDGSIVDGSGGRSTTITTRETFPSTSNQLYHETYTNGNSFINHSSYPDTNSISHHSNNYNSNSITTTAHSNNYSNYQQNYVNYTTSTTTATTCNNSTDIYDITSSEGESNSYINLHPPSSGSSISCLDALTELLHNRSLAREQSLKANEIENSNQSNKKVIKAVENIKEDIPIVSVEEQNNDFVPINCGVNNEQNEVSIDSEKLTNLIESSQDQITNSYTNLDLPIENNSHLKNIENNVLYDDKQETLEENSEYEQKSFKTNPRVFDREVISAFSSNLDSENENLLPVEIDTQKNDETKLILRNQNLESKDSTYNMEKIDEVKFLDSENSEETIVLKEDDTRKEIHSMELSEKPREHLYSEIKKREPIHSKSDQENQIKDSSSYVQNNDKEINEKKINEICIVNNSNESQDEDNEIVKDDHLDVRKNDDNIILNEDIVMKEQISSNNQEEKIQDKTSTNQQITEKIDEVEEINDGKHLKDDVINIEIFNEKTIDIVETTSTTIIEIPNKTQFNHITLIEEESETKENDENLNEIIKENIVEAVSV